MEKILFGILMVFGAVSWGRSPEKVTYGDLRPRLLLQAKEDLVIVEAYPELTMPVKDPSINLKFTAHYQRPVKKNHLYRVTYVHTFDAPNIRDPNNKAGLTVYNILLDELDRNMQPVGKSLKLGARATPPIIIGNFMQIRDILSDSVTLKTGRARLGDFVVNALPVKLSGHNFPAYSKFEVVDISKEYVPFTLSFKYTLKLHEKKTNKYAELAATGLRLLPIWAHIVSPGNERVIKFSFGELHY